MLEEGAALPRETMITYNITFTVSRHFSIFYFPCSAVGGHFAASGSGSELVHAQAREARRVDMAKPQGKKSPGQRRDQD